MGIIRNYWWLLSSRVRLRLSKGSLKKKRFFFFFLYLFIGNLIKMLYMYMSYTKYYTVVMRIVIGNINLS